MNNNTIAGVLIDLDGVLYVENERIPGALEAVQFLADNSIPFRFVTNTTRKSFERLFQKNIDMGFPIDRTHIITPLQTANQYLKQQGHRKIDLVLLDEAKEDFQDFEWTVDHPDAVLIGNIEDHWDFSLCNRIFHEVLAGAELIALHKSKSLEKENGLWIDAGAFITGIEYAADVEAVVMGKPSRSFFQLALDELSLQPTEAAMIGDDLDLDIAGAQACGMKGILVQTGKFRQHLLDRSPVCPDHILSSIAELPTMFL